jgi:hypothetical protein
MRTITPPLGGVRTYGLLLANQKRPSEKNSDGLFCVWRV